MLKRNLLKKGLTAAAIRKLPYRVNPESCLRVIVFALLLSVFCLPAQALPTTHGSVTGDFKVIRPSEPGYEGDFNATLHGCHDLLRLHVPVEGGQPLSPTPWITYTITQVLPAKAKVIIGTASGNIPNPTPGQPPIPFSVYAQNDPARGPNDIYYTWNYSTRTLVWTIPVGFPHIKYDLYLDFYFDCTGQNQSSSVPPSELTTQTTANLTVLRSPLFVNIKWPVLNAAIRPNQQLALLPNKGPLYTYYDVCLAANSGRLYDVVIQALGLHTPGKVVVNGYTLSTALGSISIPPMQNNETYLLTTPGLNTLFGRGYMQAGDCIQVTVSFNTLGVCGGGASVQSLRFFPICNDNDDSYTANPLSDALCLTFVTCQHQIVVYDQQVGLNITSAILNAAGNAITSSGVKSCEPFTLRYTVANPLPGTGFPAGATEKQLGEFRIQINQGWLNTAAITVTIGGVPTTAYTINNGLLVVNLSNIAILSGSNLIIEIQNLSVNTTGADLINCSTPDITILGKPSVSFTSLCGIAGTSYGQYLYKNNISILGYGGANPANLSTSNPSIDLEFCWQALTGNANPWNFTNYGGAAGPPFFNCGNVNYKLLLTIPSIATLTGPMVWNYNNANYPITNGPTPNSYWINLGANFPPNGCFTKSITLGTCPPGTSGFETATLDLIATCVSANCPPVDYCFRQLTNPISYQCAGSGGGGGGGGGGGTCIGVYGLRMQRTTLGSNITGALRQDRAYPCDNVVLELEGVTQAPPAGATIEHIYFDFAYPAAIGQSQPMFQVIDGTFQINNGATNSSVSFLAQTDVIRNWRDNPSQPLMYTLRCSIPVTESQAIMAVAGTTFKITMNLKVQCGLPFNTATNGLYSLQGIRAEMRYTYTVNGGSVETINSCGVMSGNFLVITHDYDEMWRKFASMEDGNPCTQVFTITTRVKGGLNGDEMPNETRPLIRWNDDGDLKITYPDDLVVVGITYSDYRAPNAPSPVVMYNDDRSPNPNVLTISGISNGANPPSWPDLPKRGAGEVWQSLSVTFQKTSCSLLDVDKRTIGIQWPRWQQDEKDPQLCQANNCAGEQDPGPYQATTTLTTSGVTFIFPNNSTIWNYTAPSANFTFTGTLGKGPWNIINLSKVFIKAEVIATGGSPGDVSLSVAGTSITQGSWFQLADCNTNNCPFPFTVQLSGGCSAGAVYQIKFTVGYSCALTPNANELCGIRTSTLTLTVPAPQLSLIENTTATLETFANCKGICCVADEKTWSLTARNTGIGPIYQPILSFYQSFYPANALLNIDGIIFTYSGTGAQTYPWTNTNGGSLLAVDLTTLGIPLPTDASGKAYLPGGASIRADVKLYGDDDNCVWNITLNAKLEGKDMCNKPYVPASVNDVTAVQEYYFDLLTCVSCADHCPAGLNPGWSTCDICSAGPPILITPTIVSANCQTGAKGSITLDVRGGSPQFTGGIWSGHPVYTYQWSHLGPPAGSLSSVGNLASGIYTVTVFNGPNPNAQQCSVTASFTVPEASPGTLDVVGPLDCIDQPIHLEYSIAGLNYRFFSPNYPGHEEITTNNYSQTFSAVSATFCVQVTNGSGCVATVCTTYVAHPLPVITASYNDPLCDDEDLELTVTPTTGLSYSWYYFDGNGIAQSVQPPVAPPVVPNTYYVSGVDGNGCTGYSWVNVEVEDCTPALIKHEPDLGRYGNTSWNNTGTQNLHKLNLQHTGGNSFNRFIGLPDHADKFSVSVYPNPFSDKLHLKVVSNSMEALQVKVFNVTWQLVCELQNVLPGSDLTLGDNLVGGVYMLKVKQGASEKVFRIIKQE